MSRRKNLSGHTADSKQWNASKTAQELVELRDLTAERMNGNPFLLDTLTADLKEGFERYRDIFRANGSENAEEEAFVYMGKPELIGWSIQSLGSPEPTSEPHTVEAMVDAMADLVAGNAARESRQITDDPYTGMFAADAARELKKVVNNLSVAEGFITSPTMHSVTIAAANSIADSECAMFSWDDLPAEHGFILLPKHIIFYPGEGQVPMDIIAFSWHTSTTKSIHSGALETLPCIDIRTWVDTHGPVELPSWTQYLARAKAAGHPLPPLIEVQKSVIMPDFVDPDLIDEVASELMGVSLSRQASDTKFTLSEDPDVSDYDGDAPIHGQSLQAWSQKYVLAFMRLAQQKVATISDFRDGIHPSTKPRPYHATRVVQLRSYSPMSDSPAEPTGRKYNHRFVVRMHKVKQWYPKAGVHKLIWRGPFIKGPENAPLLAGEKVNALTR